MSPPHAPAKYCALGSNETTCKPSVDGFSNSILYIFFNFLKSQILIIDSLSAHEAKWYPFSAKEIEVILPTCSLRAENEATLLADLTSHILIWSSSVPVA